jgi:hypothetical protein
MAYRLNKSNMNQMREPTGNALSNSTNRAFKNKQPEYKDKRNQFLRKRDNFKSNYLTSLKEKKEFKIENTDFPELIKPVQGNQTSEIIYKHNKNESSDTIVEKKTLPPGWVSVLSKQHTLIKKDNIESEISPYYNPKMARKTLENRLIYREELNELLGDISPYWDMIYPDELEDSDIDYTDEESDEEEEEYVEDW